MKKILLASAVALALFTGCTEEKKPAQTKVEAPKTEATKPVEAPKAVEAPKSEATTTTAPAEVKQEAPAAATTTAPAEEKK